jgi:hypothetical protein
LAKRQIEIREDSTGLIQGFYAGRNLELKQVERTEDSTSGQAIPQHVSDFKITKMTQVASKAV